jgi:hypothetical protein
MAKRTILYGLITVLGVIFITLFFTVYYWIYYKTNHYPNEALWLVHQTYSMYFFFGGLVFLMAGILGFGLQYLKKYRVLFTAIVVISIPLTVFYLYFYLSAYAPCF